MKAMFISAALLASAVAFADKPPAKAFGATNPKADIDDKYTETYEAIERKADGKPAKVETRAGAKVTKEVKVEKTELSQSELLDKLHKVSVGHTEMGNLAQTRGKSDKVKGFGEKMTRDFVRLDQQFIDYAKDHDIVLSDATGMFKGSVKGDVKNRDAKFDKLGKLQGEAFDRAFLTATVDGCEKLIPVLEGAKGKYEDSRFDRVLEKAIDTLQGYQKEAQQITEKDYAPAT